MEEEESFDEFYTKLKDVVNSAFSLGETQGYEKGAQIFTWEISCQNNSDWRIKGHWFHSFDGADWQLPNLGIESD